MLSSHDCLAIFDVRKEDHRSAGFADDMKICNHQLPFCIDEDSGPAGGLSRTLGENPDGGRKRLLVNFIVRVYCRESCDKAAQQAR